MKVISLSTDRTILEPRSAAYRRQEAYAERIGTMTVIVCTREGAGSAIERGALSVIPTNSSSPLFYGWDAWWIMRSLAKPDVVSVQDPFEIGLIGLLRARLWGVPLHVQIHTDYTDRHFVRHSFINRIRAIIARFVIPRATRIRVVSERVAEVLRARAVAAPVSVLPIFVDTKRYAHIVRIKHPRFMAAFVYVGRLEPEKRPEMAIDAIAAAREAGHDAGLTMVGDGSMRSALEERVRKLGIERYVDFVGWQDDIGPYLAQADALLFPSRYEGYGLTIVEALAASIPVIATDVGVAREAGAIVVPRRQFSKAVIDWISRGPRSATLAGYPYRDFDEYADRYAADIRACAGSRV